MKHLQTFFVFSILFFLLIILSTSVLSFEDPCADGSCEVSDPCDDGSCDIPIDPCADGSCEPLPPEFGEEQAIPPVVTLSGVPASISIGSKFRMITVSAKDDKSVSKLILTYELVGRDDPPFNRDDRFCPGDSDTPSGQCRYVFDTCPSDNNLCQHTFTEIWATTKNGATYIFSAIAIDSDGLPSEKVSVTGSVFIEDDDEPAPPPGQPPGGIPPSVNNPPTITSTPITSATEDAQYTYDVDASDPDGDVLTFSLLQGPSVDMTINPSTGLIQWVPSGIHVGDNVVIVQVKDPAGSTVTQQFTITVTGVNDAPVFTTIPDQTIDEDAGFVDNLVDLHFFASDEETPVVSSLTFSMLSQSDTTAVQCSLDSNRFIDCTTVQDQIGSSVIKVKVQDPESSATTTFTVNVANVNDGPTVQILQPQSTFLENEEFDVIAQATDIDFDPLTYIIDFGDGTTETGSVVDDLIQTKHSYSSEGTFTLSITVTDDVLSATDSVIVTVQPFTVKIVVNKERDKFPLRVNFDVNINGGKGPFKFEWDFNGDGMFEVDNNKKPTAVFKEKGTFKVILKVTDSDGDVATDSVTIKVTKIESMPRKIAHISSIKFENDFVKAGDNLDIFLNFGNQGNSDIKNARLTAIIQELGIRSRTVKAVVDKNKESSNFLTLEIPEFAEPGIYYVMLVIDLDGDRRIKYRPIDII